MEKNRESLPLDRKVTSRDVARVAGVSQSTVSRVFSDVSSVKPELKERYIVRRRKLDIDRILSQEE